MGACALGGQEMTSDTWELEIQEAVSHLTRVLGTKHMEEQGVSLTTGGTAGVPNH